MGSHKAARGTMSSLLMNSPVKLRLYVSGVKGITGMPDPERVLRAKKCNAALK
jgi:hypothetical protein